MMKYFSGLFLFLLCALYNAKNNDFSSNKVNSDSVFIKINLKKGEKLSLRVSNKFLESRFIEDLTHGNTVKLDVENLSFVSVIKNIGNESSVYLKKGDSIEIAYKEGKFNFTSLKKTDHFSNLNLYKDYYDFVKTRKPFDKITAEKNLATNQKNLSKVLSFNQQLFEVRNKFINDYKSKNEVGDLYVEKFLAQYKFTKLRLDYWDIKALGNADELKAKYNEISNLFKIQSIDAENVSLLFELIVDYNRFLTPASQKNDKSKFAENLFQSIKDDYSGQNRDVLMLQLLYAGRNKHLLNRFYSDFQKLSNNRDFIARAKQIVDKNSQNEVSKEYQETILKDIKGNKFTLKDLLKNSDKTTIYVDFWASWCAPCRLEMPKSLEASKKYSNVKFVYISTDQNEDQWKRAHNKILNNYGDSYLLLNESSSSLVKQINLSAIPRHIIIDKNGEISDTNAPGANDNQFENVLNRY